MVYYHEQIYHFYLLPTLIANFSIEESKKSKRYTCESLNGIRQQMESCEFLKVIVKLAESVISL